MALDWLAAVREVTALAQAGLAYPSTPYDVERYTRLRSLAAAMTAELAGADPERVRLALEQDSGYPTPKLDVRAAVVDDDGRLLLVREATDGGWTMPGGWADVGESLGEGAVRETREESGYEVQAERLLGVYERERWGHPPMLHFTLKAVVLCSVVGGEAAADGTETTGVGWFGLDDLPPLSTTRGSERLLRRVVELAGDPSLPADLD